MIRTFKNFFLRRQMREKLILGIFVAAVMVIWLNSFWARGAGFVREAKTRRATLTEQKLWLDRQDTIEATTKAALATLNPLMSLTQSGLSAALDTMSRQLGLTQNFRSTGAASKVSKQFTVHTTNVTLQVANNNTDWGKLQDYYKALEAKAPYISLQTPFSIKMTGAGNNAQVTATFKVTAVELKR